MKLPVSWTQIPKNVRIVSGNFAQYVKNNVWVQQEQEEQNEEQEQEQQTSIQEDHIIEGMNNSVVIGILLGVLSFVLNPVGIISILGLVFSIKGNTEIQTTKETGRILSIFGIMAGIVNTAFSFVTYSLLYSIIK